ncbi:energy transducer TonB [Komagataeibacter kakiaceti]
MNGKGGQKSAQAGSDHPVAAARPDTKAPSSPSSSILHCTPPAWRYPAMARHMHEEGTAMVELTLGPAGQVTQADLKTGTGYDDLDSTALAAARKVQCTTDGGTAEGRHVVLPVMFHLH